MAKPLATIETSLVKLAGIEKESKAMIAELATDCLDFLHEHGQSAVCNKMLMAVSPANQKVVFAFFKAFSGFNMSKDEGMTKKVQAEINKAGVTVKDHYANSKIAFNDFKEQGSNIWMWWNAQQVKPDSEAKPLDLQKVAKQARAWAEKADKQGVGKVALFAAMTSGNFTPEEVMAILGQLAKAVENNNA